MAWGGKVAKEVSRRYCFEQTYSFSRGMEEKVVS